MSGSNPTGGNVLQWTSVMVGTNTETNHVVHDDAVIQYQTGTANVLDQVTFDTVKNLNNGDDITFGTINRLQFLDVPLTDGSFESANGDIKGSFYGNNHEEVGGIFNSHNIIGAFGATKL